MLEGHTFQNAMETSEILKSCTPHHIMQKTQKHALAHASTPRRSSASAKTFTDGTKGPLGWAARKRVNAMMASFSTWISIKTFKSSKQTHNLVDACMWQHLLHNTTVVTKRVTSKFSSKVANVIPLNVSSGANENKQGLLVEAEGEHLPCKLRANLGLTLRVQHWSTLAISNTTSSNQRQVLFHYCLKLVRRSRSRWLQASGAIG